MSTALMMAPRITTKKRPDSERDIEWMNLEELGAFIQAELRRNSVSVWRQGKAFYYSQRILKVSREWEGWLKTIDYPKTSAWEAVRLYQHFGSEEAVAPYPITKAKKMAGIKVREHNRPERKSKPKTERGKQQDQARVERRARHQGALEAVGTINDALAWLRENPELVPWGGDRANVLREAWIDAVRTVRELDRGWAERVYHFFATDADTVEQVLDRVTLGPDVWEPCCGNGQIVKVLERRGYRVHASDLRDHEDVVGQRGVSLFDLERIEGDVMTNPPFWNALAVCEHLLRVTTGRVLVLLRTDFLAAGSRLDFFRDNPPRYLYQLSKRPTFAICGDPNNGQGTHWDYAWYEWVPGKHQGNPEIVML